MTPANDTQQKMPKIQQCSALAARAYLLLHLHKLRITACCAYMRIAYDCMLIRPCAIQLNFVCYNGIA